jgi:hypothetical protein
VYAAADPFLSPLEALGPACALDPAPGGPMPLFLLHRTCDAVAPCGHVQQQYFHAPPGFDIEAWTRRLGTRLGAEVRLQLLDDRAAPATGCAMQCTLPQGQRNHARWPDGVGDVSGHDWEPALLDHLRDHPLR